MFIGTPRNIKTPNLETVTGKPRGPFYAAKGTKLLSLKKAVASSDTQPVIGELSFVTDGEKSGEDGYFVELGPGTQWVQIDLGSENVLAAVLLWHYHSQARVYRDVVVQVSNDKDFVSGVTTIFNNDHDNTSGLGIGRDKEYIETNEGRLIDPRGAKGRYIRLTEQRQHVERHEPLRRGRGVRRAVQVGYFFAARPAAFCRIRASISAISRGMPAVRFSQPVSVIRTVFSTRTPRFSAGVDGEDVAREDRARLERRAVIQVRASRIVGREPDVVGQPALLEEAERRERVLARSKPFSARATPSPSPRRRSPTGRAGRATGRPC